MRLIFFICSAAILGACATTPPEASATPELSGLPTSELSPGQCALFGWSTGEAREFIFYADGKTARYDSLDGPVDLTAQTPFPAVEYRDSTGKPVTLRLGEGEAMSGGMRYPSARVVTLSDEGWERLHPVAVVKTCQPK